jgi:predicted enzyme related to lactoylglutathione lyase
VGSFLNGAFACEDVDALHRDMVERGVEIVDPPSDQGWGRMLLFKDSEGNTICVTSDTDANRG